MSRSFLLLALAISSPCYGDIIIDDFTDDFRVIVPAQLGRNVFSDNVGDLSARRGVFLSAIGSRPNGFLDVNGIQESQLTVSYPTTSHTTAAQNVIGPAFFVSYDIDVLHPEGVDLTDGGRADALILDMSSVTALHPTWRFELAVRSNRGHYISEIERLPYREDAHQLVFPFDSFVIGRGAVDPNMDFTSTTQISIFFEMGSDDPDLPESIDLMFVADRLRTGTVVPEPNSVPWALGLILFCCHGRRRRQ